MSQMLSQRSWQLFGLKRTGAWRPELPHDLDDLDHIGLPRSSIPQLKNYVTDFSRYKIMPTAFGMPGPLEYWVR